MDTSRDVDREGRIRAELDLHICRWKAIKGWFFLYYKLYIHIYLHGSLVGIDFFFCCVAMLDSQQNAPLKVELLRLSCTHSIISNEVVAFIIGDMQYRIDESVVHAALNFPADNLVNLTSDHELVSFFSNINYKGPLDLTKLSKSNLVDEWSCFFDTLIKVFANCTKTSFSNILSFVTVHWLRCSKQSENQPCSVDLACHG